MTLKKYIYLPLLIGVLTFVLALVVYLIILLLGNYVIDEKKLVMNASTKIVDNHGEQVDELFVENRDPVSFDDIPDHVANAFIAVEDQRFYEHPGIDVKSISRALYRDMIAGGKVEGGSTITQQLAKNIFLSNDKTFLRKTKEVIIALNLEKRYTKEKLLEMYMNQLYFGHGVYGIQAAANYYYSKDVKDLTVSEGAVLASIPKAPSNYSPILHPDKNLERRNTVISLMHDQGFLTAKAALQAQGNTLGLHVQKSSEKPWLDSYIDLVVKEAESKYSISAEQLYQGGYTIRVPMDARLQQSAYELMKEEGYFPGTDKKAEGSAVFIDNNSGGVAAAIGGREYAPRGYNRVISNRQPGSAFKPIAVFGPAMEEKVFQPYSLLDDSKQSYGGYTPRNYDGQYKGKVSMVDAIVFSKNAPAVWTLNRLGTETIQPYLEKVNINIPDKGLAVALGGLETGVSPLQMAGAYRTFAHDGSYEEPYFIQNITDQDGEEIITHKSKQQNVYSKQTAWNMTRMLQETVLTGTAKNGSYDGDLAGKTGSTSYTEVKGATKDAWFAGFNPNVTGAIWMGYDKTDKEHYLKGGSQYPTKLFKDILTKAGEGKNLTFQKPDDVKELDRPIRLAAVEKVTADYSFKALGFFTVTLKWNNQEDDRVIYRIYEKKDGNETLLESVKGENSFTISFSNVFSDTSYRVVPYNSQTNEEGKGPGYVKPKLFTSQIQS
ncbi:transglycosylase domain-containing protein [Bacillus capparidis]|uniref:Penicillin-binding protein 2A n=1 Tax=Bacillus capparidis TaxID=1840411 RepID=A0ABS4D288_9BACI|nr:PBP1A family penicillin-binding protein [Bacillus capparidis]MBP1083722.1 penicillin-binding protein 2A [Bacillus capparidis]MED1094910.1 PBP1A family penicillin-binding protein [Bacillus capparidis]